MTNEHDKNDINYIRQKISEIGSDNYSQDDFDKEFSNNPFVTNEVIITDPDYYKLKVKFVNKSNNPDPEYSHEMDSGFDLRAFLNEPVIIKPLERKLINTGLYFNLPENYELQVRSRSGLALKNGLFVLNSPGTVDNKYTNEVCIILCNLSNDDFTVNNGDRIAQGVLSIISSTNILKLVSVKSLEDNNGRSTNGFGSTGIK
jgi:dUTP pyrophosphatase